MSGETQTYVCIRCPIGCPLELVHEQDEIHEVSGYLCDRGAKYAKQEFEDPRRSFSTTIPIQGAIHARLPVKITAPIAKDRVLLAVDEVHRLSATAPVAMGQVLLAGVLGLEGVDVVATRTMRRWG